MWNGSDERMRRGEGGQSLVEFALSLVFLLVLLTGVVDAARALYAYLSMRDAAQEGALYASINPSSATGTCSAPTNPIIQRVCSSSDYMNGLGAAITVTSTPTGAPCLGSTIKVSINYPNFPLVMPLIGVFIGRQTAPIGVSVSDTILTPKCSP
jgi:Flp pilus assembly protein TadG